jgi:hypothetical protein
MTRWDSLGSFAETVALTWTTQKECYNQEVVREATEAARAHLTVKRAALRIREDLVACKRRTMRLVGTANSACDIDTCLSVSRRALIFFGYLLIPGFVAD